MNSLQANDRDWFSLFSRLIGIDEAGRGCLAGPVVAGACIISQKLFESPEALAQSALINDSKQLSPSSRKSQFTVMELLRAEGLIDFTVASGSVAEIAEHNILGATRLAMQRAIEQLAHQGDGWSLPHIVAADPILNEASDVKLLVDGRSLKYFPYAHEGVIKGDEKSLSIAMASIAAKVTRDREMLRLSNKYPAYGFAQHKGYGTAAHRAALIKHGISPIHRELFLRKLFD